MGPDTEPKYGEVVSKLKPANVGISIYNIGQLRSAMEKMNDLPDESIIYCQVVGQEYNSGAWNMHASLCVEENYQTGPTLRITHPQLLRLNPEVVFKE